LKVILGQAMEGMGRELQAGQASDNLTMLRFRQIISQVEEIMTRGAAEAGGQRAQEGKIEPQSGVNPGVTRQF
jgi:hypothetical protein